MTPEAYIALRTAIRALPTAEIEIRRDATGCDKERNACVVALAARGIYDMPAQTPAERAAEERSLARAYRSMR